MSLEYGTWPSRCPVTAKPNIPQQALFHTCTHAKCPLIDLHFRAEESGPTWLALSESAAALWVEFKQSSECSTHKPLITTAVWEASFWHWSFPESGLLWEHTANYAYKWIPLVKFCLRYNCSLSQTACIGTILCVVHMTCLLTEKWWLFSGLSWSCDCGIWLRTTPESLQFPVKSKVKSLIFSLSESAHLTFTPLTGHAHCPWPRPAKTGACAYCCMTHVKWMVPVYTELPFLHSSCTVCMFLSAAKQLKCHFSVYRRCHT